MRYRDQDFRYEADNMLELECEFVRQLSDGKQYRKKRSGRPNRRKVPKASHPGLGLAGRRNHRWTW